LFGHVRFVLLNSHLFAWQELPGNDEPGGLNINWMNMITPCDEEVLANIRRHTCCMRVAVLTPDVSEEVIKPMRDMLQKEEREAREEERRRRKAALPPPLTTFQQHQQLARARAARAEDNKPGFFSRAATSMAERMAESAVDPTPYSSSDEPDSPYPDYDDY
jgi:hypothetical protein